MKVKQTIIKMGSVILSVLLCVLCAVTPVFAQESDDTVTLYFDSPKGFTDDNTVVCSLWCGKDFVTVSGELTDNGLYEFNIPEFEKYEGLVFHNNKTEQIDGYMPYYRDSSNYLLDNGKLYLDRYGDVKGSPDDMVLTNLVYYDELNLSNRTRYYTFGEWLTLAQWHRSAAFSEYIAEKGAVFPDIVYPSDDLWYLYDEVYMHNDENGELEYSLAFGATPNKTEGAIYEVCGDYVLRQDKAHSPDPFGYYIYLSETDSYVTLKEAFELEVANIEEVFTVYGLGELIGDVDGDRILSILDATNIQLCLASLDEFNENDEVIGEHTDESVAYISDFNKDSQRNILDVTQIQLHIAKVAE